MGLKQTPIGPSVEMCTNCKVFWYSLICIRTHCIHPHEAHATLARVSSPILFSLYKLEAQHVWCLTLSLVQKQAANSDAYTAKLKRPREKVSQLRMNTYWLDCGDSW